MRRAKLALLVLLAAAPGSTAQAQDEIFVDPESPAGKEYAIPLDRARREASGVGSSSPRGDSTRPGSLFGAGISRRGGAGDRAGQRSSASPNGGRTVPQDGRESPGESAGGAGGDLDARRRGPAPAVSSASAPGGNALLTGGGIALGVLVAGGVIGVLLRQALKYR